VAIERGSTDPDSAAARAYYAAFHEVNAVLAGNGMEFTKHTAVWAALQRNLIQSGHLSMDLGRDYDFLLDRRETADYEVRPAWERRHRIRTANWQRG
jgi:uncharacterized protein (UPF0332 family)